jgi:hypothetical protein
MVAESRSNNSRNYISAVILILLCIALYSLSLYRYLLFHTVAEVFSIVIAFSTFLIAWNTRRFTTNNYVLFLGIVLLFVGILDLAHTLSYEGMGILRGSDGNLSMQLWISARYLFGLSILVVL